MLCETRVRSLSLEALNGSRIPCQSENSCESVGMQQGRTISHHADYLTSTCGSSPSWALLGPVIVKRQFMKRGGAILSTGRLWHWHCTSVLP